MGKSLFEGSAAAKGIFEAAGAQVREWCFHGTKEMLRMTQITQPSIYTVTMAAFAALQEALRRPGSPDVEIVGMAGFSMGEYAALTAAGAIDHYEKGIRIVTSRGQWMNEAGLGPDGEPMGGMIAAFGSREEIAACVAAVREDGILECVNFNSPTQTVVAGDQSALARFRRKAKEMGHIKAVPLSVGTAFHSSMMAPCAEKLKELLIREGIRKPELTVYSNVTALPIPEGEDLAALMALQAMSPVYWQETIENMIRAGVELFIEIGPGTTLSGLTHKIDARVGTANVEDMESLERTLEILREGQGC